MAEFNPYEATLSDLYQQIEDVCATFQKMQNEAAGILHRTDMPDATAQLEEVLLSSEQATNTILDSVTALQAVAVNQATEDEAKQIQELVTRIYEACSFQDISGQRIKKVIVSLGVLEGGLAKLSATVKAPKDVAPEFAAANDASLMSGPQLMHRAPNQMDVDKLFGS